MQQFRIPILIALITAVTVAIAILRMRGEHHAKRGSKPGTGFHVLHSNYSSGLGGNSTSWKVPRDPQAYARSFVPKGHKD